VAGGTVLQEAGVARKRGVYAVYAVLLALAALAAATGLAAP